MAADDLAPYVARPSAAVVLTMHDKSLSSKIKDFNYLPVFELTTRPVVPDG